VTSVNGQTGAVSLTTTNINEGTNLYYTDARARAAISAGTGISYDSATGVVTNASPDQTVSLTGAGTTSISGTYPNFTITSADSTVGTVTSVSGTGTVSGISLSGTVTSSGNLTLGGTLDLSSPPTIGNTAPNTGRFTTLTVDDNTTLGSSNTDTVTFTARINSDFEPATDNTYDLGRTGHEWRDLYIDGTANIDSLIADTADINAGTIDGTTIGAASAAAATVTTLTATADSAFTSTGAVTISKGTVLQRPGAPAAGMLRFNDDSDEFEGYNGTVWASVGGAALVNDTSTSTNVFPWFASATTGTASTLNTSDAKLLYKPSTGEFQATALVASNGIVVNSKTVSSNYTIATGNNASSAGPVTVADGVSVTVSDGSRWVVV
jgi:hypothetical protein